jgi:hypothetical protein
LFVAGGTETMYETLVKARVPFPHLMTYFVSGVEFVGAGGTAFERVLTFRVADPSWASRGRWV